jgi:hypothetical protein
MKYDTASIEAAHAEQIKAAKAFGEFFQLSVSLGFPHIKDVDSYMDGTYRFERLMRLATETPMLFVDGRGRRGVVVPLPIPAERKDHYSPHGNLVVFEDDCALSFIATDVPGLFSEIFPSVTDSQTIAFAKSCILDIPRTPEVKAHFNKIAATARHCDLLPKYMKLLGLA